MRLEEPPAGRRNVKRLRKEMTPPEIEPWLALHPDEGDRCFGHVQIGNEPFQLPVLISELLRAPRFAYTETAVHLCRAVKTSAPNTHSPIDFGQPRTGFHLL